MDQRFKQRLIGAVVLVALAVIFLPMLLSGPVERTRVDIQLDMPTEPAAPETPELPDATMLEAPEPGEELAQQPAPEAPERMPEAAVPEPLAASEELQDETAMAGSDPAESEGFYVQVGAFGSAENAERRADRLRADDYTVDIQRDDQNGEISHRVQVGPHADRETAETIAQQLADQHELSGFIIEP